MTLKEALEKCEKEYWVSTLQKCGGNVTRAAQLAGKNRTDAYKRLNKLGIEYRQHRQITPGASTFHAQSDVNLAQSGVS